MERNQNVDVLKFICSFFVVCIHTPLPGTVGEMVGVATRFAVPVFFIISGYYHDYLINNGRMKAQIKKLFAMLLISNLFYIVFGIILEIVKGKNGLEYIECLVSWKSLVLFFLVNESPVKGHLWYIGANIYVLAIALFNEKRRINRNILYVAAVFLLLIGEIIGTYSIAILGRNMPFYVSRNFLFVGLPFYYIGVYIQEKGIAIKKVFLWFIAIAALLISECEGYLLKRFELMPEREQYIGSILLAVSVFALSISYNGSEMKALKYIGKCGRYSSALIYVLHPVVIFMLAYVMEAIGVYYIYSIVAPIIVFVITIMVTNIINYTLFRRTRYNE